MATQYLKPEFDDATAIGAFHSDCCDSPVITTDSGDGPRSWFCFECGRPEQDPADRDFSPALLANLGALTTAEGISNTDPSSPPKEKP